MSNEVLEEEIRFHVNKINTSLPAKILSYDASSQKAIVEVLVKVTLRDGRVFTIPPISDVPVVFPSTDNSLISFPLSAGDGITLIFSKKSLTNFLNSETNKPTELDDGRNHALTDAIAIPGLYGFKRTPNNPSRHTLPHSTGDLVVKHNLDSGNENELRLKADGSAELTAGGTKLKINLDGDIEITGGNLLLPSNDVIAQGISLVGHVHSQPDTGPNDTVQGNTSGPQ